MKLPKLYPFKDGKLTTYKHSKYIDYVRGDSNYSDFYFKDGSSTKQSGNIDFHWAQLEAMERFAKINRSIVVNLCAIKEITTIGTVLLKSGIELMCAKNKLPLLLERFPIL